MTLKDWLLSEEKSYELGIALLAKYNKNRMLLQSLSRKQKLPKLEYELRKIAKAQGIVLDTDTKVIPESNQDDAPKTEDENVDTSKDPITKLVVSILKAGETKEVDIDSLPNDLKLKWEFNRTAYKEIRTLHEKLKLMEAATPEDRQPLIERITTLDEMIRENWNAIDAFKPGEENIDGVDNEGKKEDSTIDHKRIQANRKYISTGNQQKLAEETDAIKATKLRANMQERVNELMKAGEEFKKETIEKLKELGIEC